MLKQTRSSENYLKAIYRLSGMDFGGLPQGELPYMVGTNDLAMELRTRASSVTDMLLKLSQKGYAHYTPYQGANLTASGIHIAFQVIRRHRLWEYFLAQRLGFSSDEIHDLAEELEHVRSIALTDRLAEFLGHPCWDPHGDPIPDANGNMPLMDRVNLWKIYTEPSASEPLSAGKYSLCGLQSRDANLFKALHHLGIRMGISLRFSPEANRENPGSKAFPRRYRRKGEDDCLVVLPNSKELQIPAQVAQQLLVIRKYPFGISPSVQGTPPEAFATPTKP